MSKVDAIKSQIKALNIQLIEIQNECSRPKSCVEKEYKGSTGNWDRSEYYWVNLHCSLCDRRWSADSDAPDYRKYR